MDSRPSVRHTLEECVSAPATSDSDAAEFVRFCYRRRRVGWPELYDEMCSVAGHRLFRGWGPAELAELGIGLSLTDMPRLVTLVVNVLEADWQRRGRPVVARRPQVPASPDEPADGERDRGAARGPLVPLPLSAG